jgi:transcriptional regulator with XRE-family HTH domain
MKVGERLREAREEKGISQAKLAEEIGVDKSFIGHIEIGKSSISVETLILLADYFNVTTDYLLGRD